MVAKKNKSNFTYIINYPKSYLAKKIYMNKIYDMLKIPNQTTIPIRDIYTTPLMALKPKIEQYDDDLLKFAALKSKLSSIIVKQQAEIIPHLRDFIASFNKAIKRGEYSKSTRSYYGLPLNSANMPIIKSRQQMIDWSNNLIDGEALNVREGGTPMSHPSIDTIIRLYTSIDENIKLLRKALYEYDKINNELILAQPSVDILIYKCINDTDTYFCHLEPSVLRKHCRRWGVKYMSRRKGDAVVYKLTIPPMKTVNVGGIEVTPNTVMDINNMSKSILFVCLRSTVSEACTVHNIILQPNSKIKVKASDLGSDDKTMLNFTNPNANETCKCTVTI